MILQVVLLITTAMCLLDIMILGSRFLPVNCVAKVSRSVLMWRHMLKVFMWLELRFLVTYAAKCSRIMSLWRHTIELNMDRLNTIPINPLLMSHYNWNVYLVKQKKNKEVKLFPPCRCWAIFTAPPSSNCWRYQWQHSGWSPWSGLYLCYLWKGVWC